MKTKQAEISFRERLRKRFIRSARKHDPMLVLNMASFNFTDGWRRIFFNHEYARSNA